jgi:uncharacterized membrane protein YkoI
MIKAALLAVCMLVPTTTPMVSAHDAHTPVSYQQRDDHNDALSAIKRGEILSLGKIKGMVERKLKGKMVGERLRRTNRGWIYEVRVRRDDGKVMFAIVDAATGRIMSQR